MKTTKYVWCLIAMFVWSVSASTNTAPLVIQSSPQETNATNSARRAKMRTITLSPGEVDAKSVRITTKWKTVRQPNLMFVYVGKTSDEIKKNVGCRVQIMKGGKIILEVPYPSRGVLRREGETNFIGMVLVFNTYEEAELAEKTLRGN